MDSLCIRCKGKGLCGKPCKILGHFVNNAPKPTTHFSGPSPPEVFVGRVGYPNVNMGILAPTDYDSKHEKFNNAEQWAKSNLSIANILRLRGQLIYGRGIANIKTNSQLKDVTQELALTHKATSTEFFLRKIPIVQLNSSAVFKPMTNPAPIQKVLLQENTKIHKKIDYLTNDFDAKSVTAINELYKSNIGVDHLQKILSVGMLGKKINRKMIPTRWSITAIDDTISKGLLENIRYYKEVDEIMLFSGNYLGNYIAILLLPGRLAFDAIEAWDGESVFGQEHHTVFAEDYEGFIGRKKYASNITGGYYAMRLPVTEYLTKAKRQASVFVFRRITNEYYAPLGVGIVRETTRRAMNSKPIIFNDMNIALNKMGEYVKLESDILKDKSWLLQNYGKQKVLKEFF